MENRSGARSRDTLYLNKNLIMMGLTVNEKKIMIHVCVCHLVSTKGFELSMYIILIFIKGFHQTFPFLSQFNINNCSADYFALFAKGRASILLSLF